MGCNSSKLSQSGVVKLVSMRPPEIPDEVYSLPPIKTNINPGKSIIIKFKDGLL
jgi:hypothetical protein